MSRRSAAARHAGLRRLQTVRPCRKVEGPPAYGADGSAGADPSGGRARRARTVFALVTALTLIAFAANSLLCRAALQGARMDAASFTFIRLASGTAVLIGLLAMRRSCREARVQASWRSGAALLAYALLFSLAYRHIPAGVGALVLFSAVQLTMLSAAVRAGTGPRGSAWLGVVVAMGGLAFLVVPGSGAPSPSGVALMAASGLAWGLYSLYGRGNRNPIAATAGNFVLATVLAAPVCLILVSRAPPEVSPTGALLAIASGAIASGLGYVLWYTVLPALGAARAAVLQLAVPVIASLGGATVLGESLSLRLVIASAATLGGIAWVLRMGTVDAGPVSSSGAPPARRPTRSADADDGGAAGRAP